MGQKPVISPSEGFVKDLRYALNHLYDPDGLRSSRLAAALGLGGRFDTPSALQSLLTEAIEALKPGASAPNKAHAQAVYDLLLYRYVQQFNQGEIANQLGISVRHLRRHQSQAVYELACSLWSKYASSEEPGSAASRAARSGADAEAPRLDDLEWLRNDCNRITTDLAVVFPAVVDLIQPLAEQHGVPLRLPAEMRGLACAHPVAVQQILLSLLSAVIQAAEGAPVQLSLARREDWLVVSITARARAVEEAPRLDDSVLAMIHLSGAVLEMEPHAGLLAARLLLRSVDPIPILVVDDNPELITMFQRFTAETRYRVHGTSDPQQAVALALESRPSLIVLDIMMPQVDGLQLLSRLKHHPRLGQIPVIVCSVLPQVELAKSLGANGFLQKPVQRDAFLEAITGLVDARDA